LNGTYEIDVTAKSKKTGEVGLNKTIIQVAVAEDDDFYDVSAPGLSAYVMILTVLMASLLIFRKNIL